MSTAAPDTLEKLRSEEHFPGDRLIHLKAFGCSLDKRCTWNPNRCSKISLISSKLVNDPFYRCFIVKPILVWAIFFM